MADSRVQTDPEVEGGIPPKGTLRTDPTPRRGMEGIHLKGTSREGGHHKDPVRTMEETHL